MKMLSILSLLIVMLVGPYVTPHSTDKADPKLEAEMTRVLDEYMSAWNRKDLAAWESTFHFPHYRLGKRQDVGVGPAGPTGPGKGMGERGRRLASQRLGPPPHHTRVRRQDARRHRIHALPGQRQQDRLL